MESKDELKEIDIKNCMCYYFDDTMTVSDISFNDILINKNCSRTRYFMTFHTKFLWVKKFHCVLDLIKWMDLLKFMMELDI